MPENPKSFIVLISKGILRDRQMRRVALFWIVALALVLLGAGTTLFDSWLRAAPLLFLLYWGACIWLTLTSLMLAIFDMLMVRVEARQERERLKKQAFGKKDDEEQKPL